MPLNIFGTGDRQVERAIEQDQEGDPAALTEAPTAIRSMFLDGRLRPWLGNERPVLRRINCPNFQRNLYALIVSEAAAKSFQDDMSATAVLGRAACQIAEDRQDKDKEPGFALVLYADTPPFGRSPNTPVALIACGMPQTRTDHLWNALLRHTGLAQADTTQLSAGAELRLTNAELPIAEPRALSAEDHALIDAIRAMARQSR